ncbi:MAG: winged helix-turn-helix transcriptional regulator [Bacteroidales bacterium]|nr:winged helix-turn-helix transcriptional regulator [Bacteroidales bacterium]
MYRIEIPYITTLQNTTPSEKNKNTQKTTQKILSQIKLNPSISREELASKCGISSNGIKYHLRKLREQGLIRRVGPDKGGHWEVIE